MSFTNKKVGVYDNWDYVICQRDPIVRLILKGIGEKMGDAEEKHSKEECRIEGNNILVHSEERFDITIPSKSIRELQFSYTIPIKQCTFYKGNNI